MTDQDDRARVFIEGPAWLDPALWEPPGAEVPGSRARWLKRELDGLRVGGERLRVRLEPDMKAGKRRPYREKRSERRRRLFSKWSQGVRYDEEGLWSATPEALAEAMVEGAEGVVLDGTCGLGSIAIALAKLPRVTKVIAVDLDGRRLEMARHNAGLYGVAKKIRFVEGDAREVAARVRHDLLVLDPPWGGPGYSKSEVALADLGMDLRPFLDAPRLLLKLPRSFLVRELPEDMAIRARVDERGVLKFLSASRGMGIGMGIDSKR